MAGPIIYHYGGDEGSKPNVLAAWGLGSTGTEMLSYGPYQTPGTYTPGRTLTAPFAPYDFDAGASSFDGTGWAQVNWPGTGGWLGRSLSDGIANMTFSGWYRADGHGSGGPVMFVQGPSFTGTDSASIWGSSGRGDNMVLSVSTVGSTGVWVHTFTLTLYARSYNSLTSGIVGAHPRTALRTLTYSVNDAGASPSPIFWAFGRDMPRAGNSSVVPRLFFWPDGSDQSVTTTGSATYPGTRVGRGRAMVLIGGDSEAYTGPNLLYGAWPFPSTTSSRLTDASVDAVCVWDRILTNGEIDALRAGEPFI